MSQEETRLSRRAVLAATGGATVALAGCIGGGGASGSNTLRLSTWSGTNTRIFKEVIKPSYEDETGNTLEVVGNWQGILSKVRQSPEDDPPFDVTVGGSRIHHQGKGADLWEPVRYDNLSNDGGIKKRLAGYPMADAAVPVAYGVHAYVYDKDAIDWSPETWGDLLSDEASNVTLPTGFWFKILMAAAVIADEEPLAEEAYQPEYTDLLFDILEQVPTSTFYEGAQGLWTALTQELATVGHYFYAYGVAKARSTDDLNIGVTVPEQTTGYVDYYQIVRGTDNRQAAEELLDFMLKPETQTAYAERFNLGMSHADADHPEQTRENVPVTNDQLQNVGFRNYAAVSEFASMYEERYREFTRSA